ncbi:MAG: AAA family ATPase [Leptospiraceae bacterium]|nr:AAA family ATPase [Leptospiraceae bacterium]
MSTNKNSFQEDLELNLNAGQPYIWIETFEPEVALRIILKFFEKSNYNKMVYFTILGVRTYQKNKDKIEESLDAKFNLDDILNEIEQGKSPKVIYVLDGIHRYIDFYKTEKERTLLLQIKAMYPILQTITSHIIFLSPIVENIPIEIRDYIEVMDLPLPSKEEIIDLIDKFKEIKIPKQNAIEQNLKNSRAEASMVLTEINIIKALQKGMLKTNVQNNGLKITKNIIPSITTEKKQIIRKSGILELISVQENFDSVGGLNNLKQWIKNRKICLKAEAREYGIPQPKGVALVGVPGAGKSLSCKVISTVMELPLLRLDFGRIYGSYVGESEKNLRNAIKITEAMSPCILWIDELEKGIAGSHTGSGGTSMSEISQRIFGTFITWMQERKSTVFIVATANKPRLLPPELLRKGRFDEIFFVGFPTNKEREEIFKVHLGKYRTEKNKISFEGIKDKLE